MKLKIWHGVVILGAVGVLLSSSESLACVLFEDGGDCGDMIEPLFTPNRLITVRNWGVAPLFLWLIWYVDWRVRKAKSSVTKTMKVWFVVFLVFGLAVLIMTQWIIPDLMGFRSPGLWYGDF